MSVRAEKRKARDKWGWIELVVIALCAGIALFYISAYVGPQTYQEDDETIALWHFDDSEGTDAFVDAIAGHELIKSEKTEAVIHQADSMRGFGESITGFSAQGSLQNKSVKAHPTHTFESWVHWNTAADLPQNTDVERAQVVVAFRVGNTFGTRFYFQQGLLNLDITAEDNDNPLRTIGAKVSIKEGEWYHVAYTVKKTGNDVLAKVFFTPESVAAIKPVPVASQQFTGFNFRPGWFMIVGKKSGTGWDQFLGQIDEVRYSSIARTEFSTLDKSLHLW